MSRPGWAFRLVPWLVAALLFAVVLAWARRRPSNRGDWAVENSRLPFAEIHGDRVDLYNVRNNVYRSAEDFTPRYETWTLDLGELRSAWFVVEPFGKRWAGPAHTFLSFGFAGPRYLAVSVEVRKRKGEAYSPWKGLFRRFELMYVIADERDVVKLRSNYRKDDVYVYPVRARPEQLRRLLCDMLDRANRLRETPEFYNTLTNSCTTNIVRHVNAIAPRRIRFSPRILLPGYSDRLAYDLGLIDTPLSFEQTRARYRINDRALRYADSPDFSARIREAN